MRYPNERKRMSCRSTTIAFCYLSHLVNKLPFPNLCHCRAFSTCYPECFFTASRSTSRDVSLNPTCERPRAANPTKLRIGITCNLFICFVVYVRIFKKLPKKPERMVVRP